VVPRVRIENLEEAAHDPLQLTNLLRVISSLAERIELVEEENGSLLAGVAEDAAEVARRLAEVRRHDPVESCVQEIESKFACEYLGAQGLAAPRWTHEEQPTLRREAVSRKAGLRAELLHDALDLGLDLWREHDVRAEPVRMMDLDERRITIGIAR